MAHLSSCYFCGVALAEPLGTYRLPDDDRTVTLCSGCRKKLDILLEASVGKQVTTVTEQTPVSTTGAVEATDSSDEDAVAVSETAAADSSDTDTVDVDTGDDDETAEDSPDTKLATEMEPDVPEKLTSSEDSETDAMDPEDDQLESVSTADETAVDPDGQAADDRTTGEADIDEQLDAELESNPLGDLEPDTGTGPDTGTKHDSDTDEQSASETESEATQSGDFESTTGSTDENLPAGETTDSGATTCPDDPAEDAGEETDEPRVSISALEYNKVMRLLQNREFPVERAEIETVAANAYSLAEPDCAAVIDLAIDRGLLREEGGQLERPK